MRTRVGYAGGTTEDPTYARIGDHAESIEIDFDPEKTSYAALLDVFWRSHNPCRREWSRQYMSAIFHHDEEQRRLALETKAREQARRGRDVRTAVFPAGRFTPAEDYHQKHFLRQEGTLIAEYSAIYPEWSDFLRSSAVTRVNGYVGGSGTAEALAAEIGDLGLSAEGQARLRDTVIRE